jgi:hypothetical protein
MIDLQNERTLSLAQAAREPLFPPGRNGAKPTLSCILRWILNGVNGPTGDRIRLEAVRLGRRWITSREAIQRFAERLTPQLGESEPVRSTRTAVERGRAAERAAKQLEKAGI